MLNKYEIINILLMLGSLGLMWLYDTYKNGWTFLLNLFGILGILAAILMYLLGFLINEPFKNRK